MESVTLKKLIEYNPVDKCYTYKVSSGKDEFNLIFPWRYVGHDFHKRHKINSEISVSYLYGTRGTIDWFATIKE